MHTQTKIKLMHEINYIKKIVDSLERRDNAKVVVNAGLVWREEEALVER